MDSQRWQQIEDLYNAVLARRPEERSALLDQADPEVRREVELMLAQKGSLMDRPAWEALPEDTVTIFAAGHRLGRYEIEARLGAGGMGDVFRARDTRLGRTVAIKTSRERFSDRFEIEAQAISRLNHPHICTLYDAGPNYLVMELVEGETLAARLKRGPLPLAETLRYAIEIGEALAEAHAHGIVHRDLKPSNIMLTRHGVKVLDFGLAKMIRETGITATQVIMGTPAYMAPEQARGLTIDGRADLWSLGAVLYEASTGSPPFRGDTQGLILEAVFTKTPEAPRRRNPEVPPELDGILMKLLEKEQAERYQTAAELLADLRVLQGTLQRTSQAPPAARKSRRWLYAGGAAGVVVLAAGGLLWQRAQAKPLTDKDVLILADFVNTTGDPVFDDTLREALAIQIEESPFLKVLSDNAVRADLALLGRKPNERITNDIARDMCQREAQKATIGGSIASLGKSYAITLVSANCRTGEVLAREQTESPDKEHVLDAVAQAAKGMRLKLGESLSSIQKLEPPNESRVTTTSLQAYQLFAQGLIAFRSGDFLAAIPALQRATEIDPNFATAWDYLGIAYKGAGEAGPRAADDLSRAFALRDRVTERERFIISTQYYGDINHWTKGAEVADAWVREYPRNHIAHTMAGGLHAELGEIDEALREYSEAYRIEPRVSFSYYNMVDIYTGLNRFDEAKKVAETELAQNPGEAVLHADLMNIAEVQGDDAAAAREIQWFTGKPSEYIGLGVQASGAEVLGRLRQADALSKQADALRERHGLSPAGGRSAGTYALFGDCGAARKTSAPSAVAVALCGDARQTAEALNREEDLSAKRPEDTLVNAIQLPMYRAASELKSGHPDKAIELLAPLARYERLTHPEVIYLRGLCYLAAHQGSEAAAEFQKIVDYKGVAWGPLLPASYAGLARAYALAGDAPHARTAYQDFLAFWKDADADIPLLVQARKEYAALQ